MSEFIVRSAGWKARIKAASAEKAAAAALKRDMPAELGRLIEIERVGGEIVYWDVHIALKAANITG